MFMRCNGINHRTASPEKGSRVGVLVGVLVRKLSSRRNSPQQGGAERANVRLTQGGARADLRAERVDADHEEDEDRGRWREARCNSSDGLRWD